MSNSLLLVWAPASKAWMPLRPARPPPPSGGRPHLEKQGKRSNGTHAPANSLLDPVEAFFFFYTERGPCIENLDPSAEEGAASSSVRLRVPNSPFPSGVGAGGSMTHHGIFVGGPRPFHPRAERPAGCCQERKSARKTNPPICLSEKLLAGLKTNPNLNNS